MWITVIPNGWKYTALKRGINRITTGLNPRANFVLNSVDAELYYVTIKNFKDGKVYLDKKCDKINKNAWQQIQERSQLEKDDILFASISENGQALVITETPKIWNINESVFVLKPKKNWYNSNYLYYMLINDGFYSELRKGATGATFLSIKQDKLMKTKAIVPTLAEQQVIAHYLDDKCAKIEDTIAKQKSIVEALREYRQLVIIQAVTKGLNQDARMKDSGIEWMGKIPNQWKIYKIKYVIQNNKDGIRIGPFGSALTGKTNSDGEYFVYGQYNLINNDFIHTKHKINSIAFSELEAYEVLPGDICLSMMGTIGKCKTVPLGIARGIMDSHLIKIRLNGIMNRKFFEYVYDKDNGGICYNQMQYDKTGSIMDGLNTSVVKNLYVPLPSLEEQQQIVTYLDTKCADIDDGINRCNGIIDKLEEYKKSIIYECVTGKKEVSII